MAGKCEKSATPRSEVPPKHGIAPSSDTADRFGNELRFQAITRRLDGVPFDPNDAFGRVGDDQDLLTLHRMSRAMHAINFFGAQRQGLLHLLVHEGLLKSVKFDHGTDFPGCTDWFLPF